MSQSLSILIFPDADEATGHGFNYNEWETPPLAVQLDQAVIVRNGTQAGRATVDLIAVDATGRKYVMMITGRLLEQVVTAAKGAP